MKWLSQYTLEDWLVILGVALALILTSWASYKINAEIVGKSRAKFFRILLVKLRKPLIIMMFLIILSILATRPSWFPLAVAEVATHSLLLLWIAFAGSFVTIVLSAFKDYNLSVYNIHVADNFNARKRHTQFNVLYRVCSFFIIVITLALMLMTFNEVKNIGKSLLASAGIMSVILGIAAQKTLGSVFAGIQIALTQPIRIEDAVVVEKEWGWIEEITLTYVVVRLWDLRRLVVPITYFIENTFQNWTRNDSEIIGNVYIYTDYRVPVEDMRRELERLLRQSTLWNGKTQVLQVVETSERCVVLRALMSGRDSPSTWDLRCEIREGLVNWLRNHHPESLPLARVLMERTDDQT